MTDAEYRIPKSALVVANWAEIFFALLIYTSIASMTPFLGPWYVVVPMVMFFGPIATFVATAFFSNIFAAVLSFVYCVKMDKFSLLSDFWYEIIDASRLNVGLSSTSPKPNH